MTEQSDITPNTALMLNAGQLAYPSTECRAVALALACVTDIQDNRGAMGTGVLPDLVTLIEIADELVTARLNAPVVMHALDVLVSQRYLTAKRLTTGSPYRVDTTTLPMRFGPDDCPDVPVLETDAYGFGDH